MIRKIWGASSLLKIISFKWWMKSGIKYYKIEELYLHYPIISDNRIAQRFLKFMKFLKVCRLYILAHLDIKFILILTIDYWLSSHTKSVISKLLLICKCSHQLLLHNQDSQESHESIIKISQSIIIKINQSEWLISRPIFSRYQTK